MKKITVSESALREIIARSLLSEGAVVPEDPSTAQLSKSIRGVSWKPDSHLKLLGTLVGDPAANTWWANVKSQCSLTSLTDTTAGGVIVLNDPRFTADISQVGQNDIVVLQAFFNFVIVSLMCGKSVQAKPIASLGGRPVAALALEPKMTYDIIQKQGSNNQFVYPNDELVKQCENYNEELAIDQKVLTFNDQLFVNEILKDDNAITAIIANSKRTDISSGIGPASNTCLTSMSDDLQKKYQDKQKQAVDTEIDKIELAMKDLSEEVYEAYLYTPLLAPRIWMNPEIASTSPLYTPWRMTWSACNLVGEALRVEGKSYSKDIALYALLGNLYKMVRTGTSINVYDAPGQDFAMGKSSSVNESIIEASFMVGSVMLTEDALRRVINAALQTKLLEAPPRVPRLPASVSAVERGAEEADALRTAGRIVGAVIDPLGAASAAVRNLTTKTSDELSRLDKELKQASTAIMTYVDNIRTGKIVSSIMDAGIPSSLKTYLPELNDLLVSKFRGLVENIADNPYDAAKLGVNAKGNAAELSLRLGIKQISADTIAKAFDLLVEINLKKAANLTVDAEVQELEKLLNSIDRADADIISRRVLVEGSGDDLVQALSIVTARDNGSTNLSANAANPGGAIPAMKQTTINWLVNRVKDFNPQSRITFELVDGNIVPVINKPVPQRTATGTIEIVDDPSGTKIKFSEYRSTLTASLNGLIAGRSSAAKNKQVNDLLEAYETTQIRLTQEQVNDILTSSAYLSSDVVYTSGIKVIIGGAYESAGTIVTKGVINGSAAGLIPETSASGTLAGFLGKITGSEPSQGIVPYMPGISDLAGNFLTRKGLSVETITSERVKSGALTRSMWESMAAEFRVARSGLRPRANDPSISDPAVGADRVKAYAKAASFALGYAASFGYEAQMMIPRTKALLGQRALKGIASLPIFKPSRQVTAQKALASKWGGLGSLIAVNGVLAVLGWTASKGFTATLEKEQTGDLPATKIMKSLYVDIMRGPIKFENGSFTLMSGGPLVAILKGFVNAVKDRPIVDDFNEIYSLLDPNNPTESAKKMLSDAISNMYKNAIIPGGEDTSTLITLFPDIAPDASALSASVDGIVDGVKEVADATKEATKAAFDDAEGISIGKGRAKYAELAQKRAALAQRVSQFQQESKNLGISLPDAGELDNLEAMRLAIINDTLSALKSDGSVKTEVSKWKDDAVEETYGREGTVKAATSNWSAIQSILAQNSEFFDLTTTYLDFAGAKNPTSPVIASAKGAYGLEFTGDLDATTAKTAMTTLKTEWVKSGDVVGKSLATIAGQ